MKHLDLKFDFSSGHVVGFEEVDTQANGDSVSSSSLQREAGSFLDMVRGSSTASPFMPGGYTTKKGSASTKRSTLANPIEIEGRLDFSESTTFRLLNRAEFLANFLLLRSEQSNSPWP